MHAVSRFHRQSAKYRGRSTLLRSRDVTSRAAAVDSSGRIIDAFSNVARRSCNLFLVAVTECLWKE